MRDQDLAKWLLDERDNRDLLGALKAGSGPWLIYFGIFASLGLVSLLAGFELGAWLAAAVFAGLFIRDVQWLRHIHRAAPFYDLVIDWEIVRGIADGEEVFAIDRKEDLS